MDTTSLLPRLDAAIAAYLAHYRALRRGTTKKSGCSA